MEVERHPIYSVDTIERTKTLNTSALLVIYQSHERCNRSGYPRRRHQQFIHPMARLVAVVDTYAAVTCPRPHRPGCSPFTGMTTVLREVAAGKLDRQVVQSFLQAMSLFPVGSYVRLSNGVMAKVLRSNGVDPKTPTVVPLNADGSETDREIDLAKATGLSILAALSQDETGSAVVPATLCAAG